MSDASKSAPVSRRANATDKPSTDKRSKSERFSDVANRRLSEALDSLRLLGQTSNTANYEYTDAQVAAIKRNLTESVANVIALFENNGKAKGAKLL